VPNQRHAYDKMEERKNAARNTAMASAPNGQQPQRQEHQKTPIFGKNEAVEELKEQIARIPSVEEIDVPESNIKINTCWIQLQF
jgi:protein-tyrosine phosphatase